MAFYDGVPLVLGGVKFTVPALNFRQLKTLLPRLQKLETAGALDAEHLDIVIDLVEAALTRNYPELGRDQIEEIVTIADIPRIIAAVLTGSGFTQQDTSAGHIILGE